MTECPRCGSDTCPGFDDILECTCLVDGLSARDQARRALTRKPIGYRFRSPAGTWLMLDPMLVEIVYAEPAD